MKTILAALLALVSCVAFAGGNNNGGSSSATAGAAAISGAVGLGIGGTGSATVTGGGTSVSNKTTTFAVGGTGLTATPGTPTSAAQGSASVFFGAGAWTFTSPAQANRYYAQLLCPRSEDPDKCFFASACFDDDLDPETATKMYGCKAPPE